MTKVSELLALKIENLVLKSQAAQTEAAMLVEQARAEVGVARDHIYNMGGFFQLPEPPPPHE